MISSSSNALVIIEDRYEDRETMAEVFTDILDDTHLLFFEDGQEALTYLLGEADTAGGPPHVPPRAVIVDYDLGPMKAPEVVAALRCAPALRFVPIIVFSDSRSPGEIRACYEHGANSYVYKPIGYEEFREALRLLGANWLTLNQLPPRESAG